MRITVLTIVPSPPAPARMDAAGVIALGGFDRTDLDGDFAPPLDYRMSFFFSGPAVLTLPLATDNHKINGLALGATGHATVMEVTLPAVPSGPAVQLAWGAALNQAGVLAVLGVVFLLAYRLRSRVFPGRGERCRPGG